MKKTSTPHVVVAPVSARNTATSYWNGVRILVFVIGLSILFSLMFFPSIGITLFWNILIPIAPAILVVGTGLWRNVCPLATTSLLPDKFNISLKIRVSESRRTIFRFVSLVVFFVIIPIRHVLFNTNGPATAVLIIATSVVAVAAGFIFERKSGWCTGLCPVHPVELLYGSSVAFSTPNLHCASCVKCSIPCPDSTRNISSSYSRKTNWPLINHYLLVGAIPGYVWGWFHVADLNEAETWVSLYRVYSMPVVSGLISMLAFHTLKTFMKKYQDKIVALFAAATVSCYYWYRLPQLLGFDHRDTHGILIDMTRQLPSITPMVLQILSTTFFLWWLLIREKPGRSWSSRPDYA